MTRIFLDTANLADIEEFSRWGVISGVTTNQKIFSKEKGVNFEEQSKKILEMVHPLPVSLEGPNDLDGILDVAHEYQSWGIDKDRPRSNTVIKVPMMGNGSGLEAVKILEASHIKTNVTACMTIHQVFLAACAGASYVSLFFNRMRDMGLITEKGKDYALETVKDAMNLLVEGDFKTELIVGSIRKPEDIGELLTVLPDIITIPPKILRKMPFCEKKEDTLKEFDNAWEEFLKAEKK